MQSQRMKLSHRKNRVMRLNSVKSLSCTHLKNSENLIILTLKIEISLIEKM